jgi:hypothetical protein
LHNKYYMHNVLLRKCGDGLSAGHLHIALASLLKANGYNHAPLYIGTWDRFVEVPQYGVCK